MPNDFLEMQRWQKTSLVDAGEQLQLLTCLGRGSSGKVYDTNIKQSPEVVAKLLYSQNDTGRILREIELLTMLTGNASSTNETGIIEMLGYEISQCNTMIFFPKSELCLSAVIPMICDMLKSPTDKYYAKFLLFDIFSSLLNALNTLKKITSFIVTLSPIILCFLRTAKRILPQYIGA
ncbi:MAG: hypothetical protein NTZ67_02690 [Gammaproteobacteria bacterium]|nr:hypothetical protein [Gammaproteobacteria bacterium]